MSDLVDAVSHGGHGGRPLVGAQPDRESGLSGISVVIPTFNEAETVCRVVSRCFAALEAYTTEVIVVDDDSPDGTAERVRERFGDDERVQVMRRTGERGLTRSVVDGFERATHDRLAVIDADLQHPPEMLPELLAEVDDGAAIAIGSRYAEGGQIDGWSPWHRFVSRGGTALAKLLLPSARTVTDPLSGFFVVRADVIDHDAIDVGGYKVLLEVLTKGDYPPGSVAEVPYVFSDREQGESNRTLREYGNFVRRLLRLRRRGGTRASVAADGGESARRPALVSAYPPASDGLAHYAEGLVSGYVESTDGVTVVGSTGGEDADADGADDRRIDVRRDWQKNSPGGLYRIVRSLWESTHHYEFVHFNLKPTYFGSTNAYRFLSLFVPLVVRAVCRKPTVVTMHDLVEDVDPAEIDETIGMIERAGATVAMLAVLLAGPVTVTTERYRRLLETKYPVGEIHHVPHGIRRVGEASPVQTSPFRLLLFGYLSPYKDYETVFTAFDDLWAAHGEIELWIVGEAHPDHPARADRIRSAAAERPGVRYFGHVDDEMLPTIFEQASVLLVPYLTAPGVSGTFQKAKENGLPAIVYDEEDVLAATVGTGGTASVVPSGDPSAMRAEVERLIENPDRLATMAEANAAAADTTMADVAREIADIATGGNDE